MPVDMTKLPLPRWEVDLCGDDRDLKHLVKYFTEEGLIIYKDDGTGQTLMVIDDFPVETNHAEVLAFASEQVKVLSGVLRLARQSKKSLALGGVMLRQPNGTRHVFTSVQVHARISVEIHTSITRRDADGQISHVTQAVPLTVTLATLARTDPIVAKAMRLTVAPDAETWTGLFRLYELIEDEAGGWRAMVEKGWISSNQRDRFRHTANSSASGDASRHGHENYAPPPRPMTLDEARAFVHMVSHAWIADRRHRMQ